MRLLFPAPVVDIGEILCVDVDEGVEEVGEGFVVAEIVVDEGEGGGFQGGGGEGGVSVEGGCGAGSECAV